MTTLAFVDTETTGLDSERHEVWEVAVVLDVGGTVTEHTWQLPVDLAKADADALRVGRFYERRLQQAQGESTYIMANSGDFTIAPQSMAQFANDFAKLTFGAVLIGANPGFDERFLTRLLRSNGACPGFHYRPICITTLAAGYLVGRMRGLAKDGDVTKYPGIVTTGHMAREVPWKSDDIARAVGIDPDRHERHSALGDARWARDVYMFVMGTGHPTPMASTGATAIPAAGGEA